MFIGCEIVLEKARKSRALISVFKFIEQKIRADLTPKITVTILAHPFQDCLQQVIFLSQGLTRFVFVNNTARELASSINANKSTLR